MILNILWFIFVMILFAGFFVLEGFDYGVGMLLPWLGRKEADRRAILRTIGPHWDGNEVWMITAGGALFAAFPAAYATLFSAFYLPVVLLLAALIVRGAGFEYRNRMNHARWRIFWDWGIFAGSLLAAFLWGVVMGNLARGFAIRADGNYYDGLLPLLNPYALASGLLFAALFTLHGAIFLIRKAPLEIAERAAKAGRSVWLAVLCGLILFDLWTWQTTDILSRPGLNGLPASALAWLVLLFTGLALRQRRTGWAFLGSALTILCLITMIFTGLYPRILISTLDPGYSLTITNAASSAYTLRVMTIVTVFLLPLVLTYQAWTYWVFRQRVSVKVEESQE